MPPSLQLTPPDFSSLLPPLIMNLGGTSNVHCTDRIVNQTQTLGLEFWNDMKSVVSCLPLDFPHSLPNSEFFLTNHDEKI